MTATDDDQMSAKNEPEYVVIQPGLGGVAWLGEVIDGELAPLGKIGDLLSDPTPTLPLTEVETAALREAVDHDETWRDDCCTDGVCNDTHALIAAVEKIIAAREAPMVEEYVEDAFNRARLGDDGKTHVTGHPFRASKEGVQAVATTPEGARGRVEKILSRRKARQALPGVTQAPTVDCLREALAALVEDIGPFGTLDVTPQIEGMFDLPRAEAHAIASRVLGFIRQRIQDLLNGHPAGLAPTVALDRETVARALFAAEQCTKEERRDIEGQWLRRLDDRDHGEYRAMARDLLEVLADPRRTEATVQAEALREFADTLDNGPAIQLPPSVFIALARETADRIEAGQ